MTSSHISDEDLHFRQVHESWVDMSLGGSGADNEVEVAVNAGHLMAFNWEEGPSMTSMNTTNSGLPGEEMVFEGDIEVSSAEDVGTLSNEEVKEDEDEKESTKRDMKEHDEDNENNKDLESDDLHFEDAADDLTKNMPEGYINEDLEDAEDSGTLDVRSLFSSQQS